MVIVESKCTQCPVECRLVGLGHYAHHITIPLSLLSESMHSDSPLKSWLECTWACKSSMLCSGFSSPVKCVRMYLSMQVFQCIQFSTETLTRVCLSMWVFQAKVCCVLSSVLHWNLTCACFWVWESSNCVSKLSSPLKPWPTCICYAEVQESSNLKYVHILSSVLHWSLDQHVYAMLKYESLLT